MLLLAFVVVIVAAIGVRLALPGIRRRRMAAELRGDWWPRFERELEDYASRSRHSARGAKRDR